MRAHLVGVLAVIGACTGEPTATPRAVEPVESPRRLTRYEYDNTVRDLLGTDLRPARTFPAGARGLGFDNIASLQTAPTDALHFERAASALAHDALERDAMHCGHDRGRACAVRIVDDLAPRAWRRPLTDAERHRLLSLYDTLRSLDDDPTHALVGVVEALLLSPAFLLRIERDPHYGMATRLSYFLWSSLPDDALFEAAAHGELADPDLVDAQIDRMLDDPRATALTESFAGQWLHFRALDDMFKDHSRFPGFDDALRASMRAELDRFFASFIRDDRDLRTLLTATETEVDARVANLYGVAAPPGDDVFTLDLSTRPRRGLLTMPGMMAGLARPFRTAPVKRGAWVLSQLQCAPPPPPPDGVEGFSDDVDATTVHEQLAQHRADPACAGCHDTIDPIGLAFEPYDALGRWRDDIDGQPIDTQGTLPDGTPFADALELSAALAASDAFVECAARQAMTYALGRALDEGDEVELAELVEDWAEAGYRTRALFKLVARTPAFRGRP